VPTELVPDGLAVFYLVTFLVGLLFVLVSAVMGLSHDFLHLPGLGGYTGGDAAGADFGHAGDAGHPLDLGHDAAAGHSLGGGQAADAADTATHGRAATTASPFSLMTIMAFLLAFGGAGFIMHAVYGMWGPLSFVLALAPGLLAGWLIFMFLVKVLLPGTRGMDLADVRPEGKVGHVTVAIPAGGIGEIVYSMGETRHSDGARSLDGKALAQGTEVVIIDYEKGIARVQPLDLFLALNSPEAGEQEGPPGAPGPVGKAESNKGGNRG